MVRNFFTYIFIFISSGVRNFVMVNIHVKPENAVVENDALAGVVDDLVQRFPKAAHVRLVCTIKN